MFEINKEDKTQFRLEELCEQALQIKVGIDSLTKDKKEVEDEIREILDHSASRDGAETYKRGVCKIAVTTGLNYRVDAKYYEACRDGLNPSINPIAEKVSYSVDKKKLETMHEFGTNEELDLLEKIILTSPKKPAVKIEITKDHLAS